MIFHYFYFVPDECWSGVLTNDTHFASLIYGLYISSVPASPSKRFTWRFTYLLNYFDVQVCQKLGWKGNGGPHDILPLVLQAEGGIAEVFDIPPHLILEVDIEHPK